MKIKKTPISVNPSERAKQLGLATMGEAIVMTGKADISRYV